jgi:hypothetical protein
MKITIKQLKHIIAEAIKEATVINLADDELPDFPEPKSRELSELEGIYSDVYKEKYGIRPRWIHSQQHTVEELQAELDKLYKEPGYDNGWEDWDAETELQVVAPEVEPDPFEKYNKESLPDDPYEDMSSRTPIRKPSRAGAQRR